LLSIENLKVEFPTPAGIVKAVRGVTFNINDGETLALVGESGCGKSVTAHSILKLFPSPAGTITSGNIYFAGEDLISKNEKQLREIRGKDIGFIFQDPVTSLNPTMKVGHQIMEVIRKHRKVDQKKSREQALELFTLVGIPNPDHRLDQYPHQLSGGMQQRVMIAIGLACSPQLLIADEPTTAVDVTIQAQLIELLKDLQKKKGMSILLITHNLALISGFARRVAVMYAGKIVETGTTAEVIKKPAHPYTMGLLASIPEMETSPRKKLVPIPGHPPALINPPSGCSFWPRCPKAMNICIKLQPVETVFEQGRRVSCWLVHPMAHKTTWKDDGKHE